MITLGKRDNSYSRHEARWWMRVSVVLYYLWLYVLCVVGVVTIKATSSQIVLMDLSTVNKHDGFF